MSYTQGSEVVVSGPFRDPETGDPVDPSTVHVTIVRPNGQRKVYTFGVGADVVKDSVGNYHIDVLVDIPGVWAYWWHSEGTGKAADEKTFMVTAAIGADPPGEPSSLELNYQQILREVGRLLGISREPNSWLHSARQDVADIIRSGLRRFYWPVLLPTVDGKSATVHSWSFLKATKTLELKQNTSTYALPEDFGEAIGSTFIFSAGSKEAPIGIVGDEQIRQLQAAANVSGTPKYVAIRQLSGTPLRYEAVFYPTPNTDATLNYDYNIAPPDLSDSHPIPYGGPQHAETILEAILAAAEKTLLDTEGIHEKKFLDHLARSIASDKNLTAQTDDAPWPLEAADGLRINKAYLKRLIGLALEYGPHSALWTHRQSAEVDLVLQTGLRKFYSPIVLPGDRFPWEWSFLKPVYTLVTKADQDTYTLPEDLAIVDGPLTHAPTAAALYPAIRIVGENQVRYRQQQSTASGRPTIAAVRPKQLDPNGGTRWEMLFWPPPDGEYSLTFRYQVNPDAIPEDASLPYGGQVHAQTIIESCLCAAEERQNVKNGLHYLKYVECLTRSVRHDQKASAPASLGCNTDYSDLPTEYNYHEVNETLHRYNGQLW